MKFSFDSVEAIRAQLDPVLAVIGWRVSFADHESLQYIGPAAEKLTHHSYPHLVPSVDWFSGESHLIEMTDFSAKIEVATNGSNGVARAPGAR
jgi:hypothetical protein